jgi:hypothetical protein
MNAFSLSAQIEGFLDRCPYRYTATVILASNFEIIFHKLEKLEQIAKFSNFDEQNLYFRKQNLHEEV